MRSSLQPGWRRSVAPTRSFRTCWPADQVAAALAALPEDYRTVCTLYFMEDSAYQEIADIVGVPIGTVRSRLHRGRKMLQKQLWNVARDLGIVRSPSEVGA